MFRVPFSLSVINEVAVNMGTNRVNNTLMKLGKKFLGLEQKS